MKSADLQAAKTEAISWSFSKLSSSERMVLIYGSAIPVGSRLKFTIKPSGEQSRGVNSGWLPSSITVYNIRDY